MTLKKRGLGKGLDALLSTSQAAVEKRQQTITEASTTKPVSESQVTSEPELLYLGIDQLAPGKYQPRRDMSAEALEELAESIRAQGIIQPIVVRKLTSGYEIIAGERRWRASQLAGLQQVPCVLKQVEDDSAVAIALIENIQREDLNAMEEAVALQRLQTEFELTHQQIAEAVGKSRTTVTNLLRLNALDVGVKRFLEHGDIEMGHARALLAVDGELQTSLAKTVVAKGLTVRETERLVTKAQHPVAEPKATAKDHEVVRLETELVERLGAKVSIKHNSKGKGKIVIDYQDLSELDGILSKIR